VHCALHHVSSLFICTCTCTPEPEALRTRSKKQQGEARSRTGPGASRGERYLVLVLVPGDLLLAEAGSRFGRNHRGCTRCPGGAWGHLGGKKNLQEQLGDQAGQLGAKYWPLLAPPWVQVGGWELGWAGGPGGPGGEQLGRRVRWLYQ
jgi:hypothetical protein